MSTYVYSEEDIPRAKLIGKPGYSPEYIQWNGVQVVIPEKQWIKLDSTYRYKRHVDWKDRIGTDVIVTGDEIGDHILRHYHARGVIVLDHEPTAEEREGAPLLAHKLNIEHRRHTIQIFEDAVREKETSGIGRTRPTPYEDECYEVLGFPKPYSLETMRDQRRPGEASAERLAESITRGMKEVLEEARKSHPVPAPAVAPSHAQR